MKFLKKNPEAQKSPEKSEDAVAEIPRFNISILPPGLYIMNANGIRDIATNDLDFEQVDWITVWKPSWMMLFFD